MPCSVAGSTVVYLRVLRELAQHGGYADIIREQILDG
jgi:hypothetical protein